MYVGHSLRLRLNSPAVLCFILLMWMSGLQRLMGSLWQWWPNRIRKLNETYLEVEVWLECCEPPTATRDHMPILSSIYTPPYRCYFINILLRYTTNQQQQGELGFSIIRPSHSCFKKLMCACVLQSHVIPCCSRWLIEFQSNFDFQVSLV